VLHDLNLAAAYCPRLVLLAAGRVVADGPPEAVLTAERLRDLYRVDVSVHPDPVHGRPHVYPVRALGRRGEQPSTVSRQPSAAPDLADG